MSATQAARNHDWQTASESTTKVFTNSRLIEHAAIKQYESRGSVGDEDSSDSLSSVFNDEIETWARRALLANGFGGW